MFRGILPLLLFVGLAIGDPSCRFASYFEPAELYQNPVTQNQFIELVAYWEGHFHQDGVGINMKSGLTYDGHPLNYTTGELTSLPHLFSASSKESVHVNLLTLALSGDSRAAIFVNYQNPELAVQTAIKILTNKISSYEKFNKQYPGFGGFFPWFNVSDDGMAPAWNWPDIVPGLDNGQLVWAIYALIPALEVQGETRLARRWQAQFDLMVENVLTVFYAGEGRVRAVTQIANVSSYPDSNNYTTSGNAYLDDPYEGELMAFFMDLFGKWENDAERELIWIRKRPLLQSVNYLYDDYENITVQRGWWFSAHEQWKIMELPYLSVPIARRVFTNCERARTANSEINNIPGLYASVNMPTTGGPVVNYLSAAGIQQIAFQNVTNKDVITPYGSMATLLVNPGIGLLWYQNMLLGPKMQGPYGSTESININGTQISPITTWDSKITSLDAMLGGIYNLTQILLIEDGLYDRFEFVVDREYSLKFPNIVGEDVRFGMPSLQIPTKELGFFSTCSL